MQQRLGFCDDDPIRMRAGADYLTAFYESLKQTGDLMTSTDEQTEAGKAGRLMRKAILLELQRERGQADDGATDKLRLIARRLVDKAVQGDMQAIKEVLDRIDVKSVPGPGDAAQGPRQHVLHPERARQPEFSAGDRGHRGGMNRATIQAGAHRPIKGGTIHGLVLSPEMEIHQQLRTAARAGRNPRRLRP